MANDAPDTGEDRDTSQDQAGQWVQIHQAQYDEHGVDDLTTSLIYAIAKALNIDLPDHTKMPPLYESFDATALEGSFFASSDIRSNGDEPGTVSFRYSGCKVTLGRDGWISVYEPISATQTEALPGSIGRYSVNEGQPFNILSPS